MEEAPKLSYSLGLELTFGTHDPCRNVAGNVNDSLWPAGHPRMARAEVLRKRFYSVMPDPGPAIGDLFRIAPRCTTQDAADWVHPMILPRTDHVGIARCA